MLRLKTILLSLFLLIMTLSPSQINSPFLKAEFSPAFEKGFSYPAWSKDAFKSSDSDKSIENLAQTGTKWVAVVPTWVQDTIHSTYIYRHPDMTPTDESLAHAIKKIQGLGLKVMLKPHVDPMDTANRGMITFSNENDWQAWFNSYKNFITHYADLAYFYNVEQFSVGCELLLTESREQNWREVISEVRKRFPGPLTYAANGTIFIKNIKWWDALDYIGIDAYFPLTTKNNPTYEELKNGWNFWIPYLEEVYNTYKKPIIFTEIGYRSIDGANKDPGNWHIDAPVDLQEQADCYRAALETFWPKSWFCGMFWWNWETNPNTGGSSDKGYTPHLKPAENILKSWYLQDITPPSNVGCFSPVNNARGISLSPTLTSLIASDSSLPIEYSFQISKDNNFVKFTQQSGWTGSHTWQPPQSLEYNTIYYWRVKARDRLSNEGNFSPIFSFKTLSPDKTISRLFGGDRYTTAIQICKNGWISSDYVVIARGDEFPDALSGVVLASKYDAPLLLTPPDSLNQYTADEIKRIGAKEVFILGNGAAISSSVVKDLQEQCQIENKKIHRFGGIDRYETSAIIAAEIGSSRKTAIIATGENFPDALSAAPLAGSRKWPLLLVNGLKSEIGNLTRETLTKLNINQTIIIGQVDVVSKEIEENLKSSNSPVKSIQRIGGDDRYQTCLEIIKYRLAGEPFSLENVYLATGRDFPDALSGSILAAKSNGAIILTPEIIGKNTFDYLKINSSKIYNFYLLGGNDVISDTIYEQLKSIKS